MTWYLTTVTLHVLAALVWLGGLFFFALVGAPVLRELDPPELRALAFERFGKRFRTVGWIAIGVLIATGLASLALRGLLSWDVLADSAFWGGRYGRTLAWKLGAVGAMLVTSAVHDFAIGPRASRAAPGSPEALRLRRLAGRLGRLNALLGLVLLVAAVRLARGG